MQPLESAARPSWRRTEAASTGGLDDEHIAGANFNLGGSAKLQSFSGGPM
jgi:hypothetical protein